MASERETLEAISKNNALNPIQRKRLEELRIAGSIGQESGIESPTGSFLDVAPKFAGQIASQKRDVFQKKLRGEEESFLGRFRTEFPEILTGISEQLGLPALRETAFQGLESFGEIPEVQTQAARGRDISANQLARIISAEETERLPGAQKAVGQAQFAEGQFTEQAGQALVPFETEIGFLKDRFSREASGFNQDAEAELNILLQQIQQEGATNIANIQKATQLAQLEQRKTEFEEGLSTIDLGNRVAIIDREGNEVSSFAKAKLGGGGGGGVTDADIDAELGVLTPTPSGGGSPTVGAGGFGLSTNFFG